MTLPSFDRLAPAYATLERITYGPLLQRCRTAHLSRLGDRRRALLLGDGDGRFLTELLRSNPHVLVDSLDISPVMLSLSRRRVAGIPGGKGRVRFLHADARSTSWSIPGRYDLVVTNFFLDCFPADELKTLINRVAASCLPGALWLDGDFRLPSGRWAQATARVILAGMYLFFALTTRLPASRLVDSAPLLAANGFTLSSESNWLRGLLSSRLWVAVH